MKIGDIGIKAVAKCKEGYCLRYNRDSILKIGEVYKSDFGCSFCDKASETLKYFEYPFAMKYLELRILSEPKDLENGHSFSANEVEVLREVSLDELRTDKIFDEACTKNKEKQIEFQNWFENEMKEIREEREERDREYKVKFKLVKKLIVFEYLFVFALIIIPLALHFLGFF